MKIFLKFIFIIISFISIFSNVSFGTQNVGVCVDVPFFAEHVQGEIFSPDLSEKTAQIVSTNGVNFEITAINDRKDVFTYGSLDKTCAQNKFIAQLLNAKYNQTYIAKSHNISSYLKNEICTRAP